VAGNGGAKIKKEISIFLLLLAILNAPFYVDFKFSILLFWTPAIAALLTDAFLNGNIKNLGWCLRGTKYLFLGLFLPIMYGAIIYGALILTGANVVHGESLKWLAKPNGMRLLFGAYMVKYFVCSLGEEIGWRGFLSPRFVALKGLISGGIVSGLIWAFWHYPMMLTGKFAGEPNIPFFYCILSFTLTAIGFGVLLTWLRERSDSVWPCVFFHASHNLFTKLFFIPLTNPSGATAYIAGKFGFAFVVTGLIFILMIKQTDSMPGEHRCQK